MPRPHLFSILFVFILFIPLISGLVGLNPQISLEENRHLSLAPPLAFSPQFTKSFTAYFNDRFHFRNFFIASDRWLRYRLFSVSPNKAITIGNNQWLYYTPDVQYIDAINAQPFSVDDLSQIASNLSQMAAELKSKKISAYVLVAPNKHSIYPEYLPSYFKPVNPTSRLDQLTEYLGKNTTFPFINPKLDLITAKASNPVYLKYDTHWNPSGAFIAYSQLLNRVHKDFHSVSPFVYENFNSVNSAAPVFDLALQMGVLGDFKENELRLTPPGPKSKIVFADCPNQYTGCPLTIREIPGSKLPKLLMFRDSFAVNLIPFISEHFSRSYFYWGHMPYAYSMIAKEKPDIIIFELTERELWRLKDKLIDFDK